VAAFEPELVVELDAELEKVGDPCRGLLRENRGCARPREPAAGPQRVLGVQVRAVAEPRGGGDSALREVT